MENYKHNDSIVVTHSINFSTFIKEGKVGRVIEVIDRKNVPAEYSFAFNMGNDHSILMIEFYDFSQNRFKLTLVEKSLAYLYIKKIDFNYENNFPAPDGVRSDDAFKSGGILAPSQEANDKSR